MTQIYEALEIANKEKSLLYKDSLTLESTLYLGKSIEHKMVNLYQAVCSMLPDTDNKILQFVSTRENEGTSTIVREYAKTIAFKMNQSVLLIDSDRFKPSHGQYFDLRIKNYLNEIEKDDKEVESAVYQVGQTKLHICQVYDSNTVATQSVNSTSIKEQLNKLRDKFDMILIDSMPLSISNDSLNYVKHTDGIIMNIESEQVKYQIAQKATSLLAQHGAKILGVVLNKQRYPIPNFIYKRI